MLTQDVIWTSIQRFLNVIDVKWTSKQHCVLTKTLLIRDVIRTSIQRFLNAMNVVCVLGCFLTQTGGAVYHWAWVVDSIPLLS